MGQRPDGDTIDRSHVPINDTRRWSNQTSSLDVPYSPSGFPMGQRPDGDTIDRSHVPINDTRRWSNQTSSLDVPYSHGDTCQDPGCFTCDRHTC
jgi:hypothetical protein